MHEKDIKLHSRKQCENKHDILQNEDKEEKEDVSATKHEVEDAPEALDSCRYSNDKKS